MHLGEVFDGPFDLLLGMIAKQRLDVTEISLSLITDDFIAHVRRAQTESSSWDLDQASEFLLIAATLLEIKAARLLPKVVGVGDEDFELIEARDLLFARLLQYRAFKDVAEAFADQIERSGRLVARQAGLESRFAGLLPELVMTATPEDLAVIAARALTPKAPPVVAVDHLHVSRVSVREQAVFVVEKLRKTTTLSFAELVNDADSTLVVVARFLALLELFKDGAVEFDQPQQLAPLVIHWRAEAGHDGTVSDEFDHDPSADHRESIPGLQAG